MFYLFGFVLLIAEFDRSLKKYYHTQKSFLEFNDCDNTRKPTFHRITTVKTYNRVCILCIIKQLFFLTEESSLAIKSESLVSEGSHLPIVNCKVSQWSRWSKCRPHNGNCGEGLQTKSRRILVRTKTFQNQIQS